jgi:uncharacterized membrane protein YeaQ/YmgE (transglycosylase-associated protein family)
LIHRHRYDRYYGDDDAFDWGGIIGAVIGAVIVVAIASWAIKRFAGQRRLT